MDTAGPPREGMISINEAARRCNVSRRTVVNWIDAGDLATERAPNGYNVWLDADEVAEYDRCRREDGMHRIGRPKGKAEKPNPALALRLGDRQSGPGA
jgi:excisionase family DNA binding protein